MAQTPHCLICAYFRCLAAFRLAVNGDVSVGDHELALPPAVGDSGEFEQVTERDMFAAQFECQNIHAYAPRRRHR